MIKIILSLTRYASRLAHHSRFGVGGFTRYILLSIFLLPALSARAGDLSVDNLTVSNNATFYGQLNFDSIITGTNGSAATATGGTITTNGNYRIHKFTNNGTFEVSSGSLNCDVLIVAGGGSGGNWGGGGAGGVIYTSIVVSAENTVIVGAGGLGGSSQSDQAPNSVFSSLIAYGGGRGANNGGNGYPGGSGGGSGDDDGHTPGAGTNGQGFAGGTSANGWGCGGGGGGSAEVGHNGTPEIYGGNGGDGVSNNITGTYLWYGGGGGGRGWQNGSSGVGGKGGGGRGGLYAESGYNGTNNTGGGGGGGSSPPYAYGGSGIVIVRYLTNQTSSSSSNVTTLTVSSNGINQISASGANIFMGKVGIGTDNPAEKLHVAGNLRVDGTNIVSAITLGEETRSTWPAGNLTSSNNLSDITDMVAARTNLGLGTAATNDASAFDLAGTAGAVSNTLSAHTANLNNPHQVTAAQVGALTPAGSGAQLTGITAAQVGALSTTGGVVNGAVTVLDSDGDLPMGVYTNQ